MDSDFGNVSGGAFDIDRTLEPITSVMGKHLNIVLAVMVALVILCALMFFGWIGTAIGKKEGLKSCGAGNISPLCRQIRDGTGEGLTSSYLAQGFAADSNSFCKGAGTPTDDPFDYMRQAVNSSESLTPYASPADQFDQNLAIAMQH